MKLLMKLGMKVLKKFRENQSEGPSPERQRMNVKGKKGKDSYSYKVQGYEWMLLGEMAMVIDTTERGNEYQRISS